MLKDTCFVLVTLSFKPPLSSIVSHKAVNVFLLWVLWNITIFWKNFNTFNLPRLTILALRESNATCFPCASVFMEFLLIHLQVLSGYDPFCHKMHNSFLFLNFFGGHRYKSFSWGHLYPWFGLLVTSVLGFKDHLHAFSLMWSSDSPLVRHLRRCAILVQEYNWRNIGKENDRVITWRNIR